MISTLTIPNLAAFNDITMSPFMLYKLSRLGCAATTAIYSLPLRLELRSCDSRWKTTQVQHQIARRFVRDENPAITAASLLIDGKCLLLTSTEEVVVADHANPASLLGPMSPFNCSAR